MILQFPISDMRGTPNWSNLVSDTPFGPQEPTGFSNQLKVTLSGGLTADLLAPFDGYMQRIILPNESPTSPALFEIQPLAEAESLQLTDGLMGQLPRVRLRAQVLHPTILNSIKDQVTATEPTQQVNRETEFLAGKYSIFVERGTIIASGLDSFEIEIRSREGVAIDPVAYYYHYLSLPAGANDPLADRDWLSALVGKLTRRSLIQIVDEQGAPISSAKVHRPPGMITPEIVDVSGKGGTLVSAEFTAPNAVNTLIESIEIPEPTPEVDEQGADRYIITSEWPFGDIEPVGPIPIASSDHPIFRRFVATHLRSWFASQNVQDELIRLKRYTFGNRVEPLVDGIATFKRMYEDIKAIPNAGASRFYYLSAWSLTRNVSLCKGEDNSDFQTLMEELVGKGAKVRLMLWDQLHQNSSTLRETMGWVLVAIYVLTGVASGLIPPAGWIAFSLLSAAAIGIGTFSIDDVANFVSSHFEPNNENVQELSDAGITAFLDGRVRETPTTGATRFYDYIGSHHQKISLVSSPTSTIAYCGGIDINSNRVDDQDHFINAPYHDLHSRIEGPAAADIVATFRQRWNEQHPADLADDGPPITNPVPDGTHVVQVARTYPNKINEANEGYSFAPNGDFTVRNTLKQAISKAKRFIYIEDQYLTPPDDVKNILITQMTNEPQLRLIMVIPRAADQPENSQHRADFIASLLNQGFDVNRVVVLFPTKFVFPHDPERHGPIITRLTADVSDTTQGIPVEDPSRFADEGIILVDEEEIKYTTRDVSGKKLVVGSDGRRGFNNTTANEHKNKTSVQQLKYQDIYVHAKCWIIDDIFVSIGSANLNRRGMTHDSECNVFVIDGTSDRGARSFAKQLRINLWAEHLGISNSAAARLLLDNPDEAIEFLIAHPGPAGNRLRRYWHTWNSQLKTESWLSLLKLGVYWDAATLLTEDMWNTYFDPDGSNPFP